MTTGLKAVSAADQLEAVSVITFCTASHVQNQLGVSSLLSFDLGELSSDVVKLQLSSKVKPLLGPKVGNDVGEEFSANHRITAARKAGQL